MSEFLSNRRVASEETLLPPGVSISGSHGTILSVGLRLFAERGFGGASVRDIAKAAGLQPATLYVHFPSKEHVLAEIIRIGHEEHQQRLRRALHGSVPEPDRQLFALVREHVLVHAQYPMLTVVANNELHALSPAFAAPSLQLRRQSEQMFLDIVERGIERGVFHVRRPWLAVAAIGGMGLRVAHWYTPDLAFSAGDVADDYAEFALRIVAAAPLKAGT